MVQPGGRAPDFHLQDLTGSEVSLVDLLTGGPVLVVFFKISCPTCQYTFPFLQRFVDGAGIAVVGISQDTAEATRSFCRTYGITFPVLLDQARERYPVSNAYGITTVPSHFWIQSDGIIARSFGGFSRQDLEEIGQALGFVPFSQHERVPAFKPG